MRTPRRAGAAARGLLSAACVGAATLACGETPTRPADPTPIGGVFRLQSVAGEALPWITELRSSGLHQHVVAIASAELTLEIGSGFREVRTMRQTSYDAFTGAEIAEDEWEETSGGTWRRAGIGTAISITLQYPGDPPWGGGIEVGSLVGDALTIERGGFAYRYARVGEAR